MQENITENKELTSQVFPDVQFCIDEEFEITKLNNFLSTDQRRGGVNLTEMLLEIHPGLRTAKDFAPEERLVFVQSYVHDYYDRNRLQLEKSAKTIKKEWDEYAPKFFKVAGNLFKDRSWPKGEYVGYISISPPYPRYLDSKIFHFPHNSISSGIRVTAHEMLHFMFYDHVRQRYTPELANTNEQQMEEALDGRFSIPLWELSEIFNIVVQSGEEFGRGQVKQESSSYSHLVAYSERFRILWEESEHDLDRFFTTVEL